MHKLNIGDVVKVITKKDDCQGSIEQITSTNDNVISLDNIPDVVFTNKDLVKLTGDKTQIEIEKHIVKLKGKLERIENRKYHSGDNKECREIEHTIYELNRFL